MNYEVMQSVNAKTAAGMTEIIPIGAILNIEPAKAELLVKEGKLRPFDPERTPTTEHGRQRLEMIMDAATRNARDEIIKACNGRQFKANNEIRQTERDIEILQDKVFTGEAKVQDFTEACQRWADVSIKVNI